MCATYGGVVPGVERTPTDLNIVRSQSDDYYTPRHYLRHTDEVEAPGMSNDQ